MKFLFLIFFIFLGAYIASSEADHRVSIHLEDSECKSVDMADDGSVEGRFVLPSVARCHIDTNKMVCYFSEKETGKSQGSERFDLVKMNDGNYKAKSKDSYTMMSFSLTEETYSYHLTGFRAFKDKLTTQICSGKIH